MQIIKNENGVVAIEAAIILPVFSLFCVVVAFLGLAFLYDMRMTHIAQNAATCWSSGLCANQAAAQDYINNAAPDMGVSNVSFSMETTRCCVEVTATYSIEAPFFGTIPITTSASAPLPANSGNNGNHNGDRNHGERS